MMRLDIRSLLQDAAIEEVRISVLVKTTNQVNVTVLKIRSRQRYHHSKAVIVGTVESQYHCVRKVCSIILVNCHKHEGTLLPFITFLKLRLRHL